MFGDENRKAKMHFFPNMKLTIFASREEEGKVAECFEIRRAFFEAHFSLTTQAHQIQTSVASKYIKVFDAPKLETYR